MTIAEELYNLTKEMPESIVVELLDYAEFLKQKKMSQHRHSRNIAQRIHQRFEFLEGENLPIPVRQLTRMPPDWKDQ